VTVFNIDQLTDHTAYITVAHVTSLQSTNCHACCSLSISIHAKLLCYIELVCWSALWVWQFTYWNYAIC